MSGTPVKYFVILPDGQRFGPADIQLLNQWAAEGRVLPTTMLEQEGTQMQIPASSVPGLALSAPGPFSTPPQGMGQAPGAGPHSYAGYYRPPNAMGGDLGHNDLTLAWVFSSLGLCVCFLGGCCNLFGLLGLLGSILGLVFSTRAQQKGNPGAQAAKVFSWVVFSLQIIGIIALLGLFGIGLLGGYR